MGLDKCDLTRSGFSKLNKILLSSAIKSHAEILGQVDDLDSAKRDFINSPHYSSWASGIKARYCNFLCTCRGECDVKYDTPRHNGGDLEFSEVKYALGQKGLGFIYNISFPELLAEIERNKHFMIEKRKYTVSWGEAEQDYVANYLEDFERGFCLNEPLQAVIEELENARLEKAIILEREMSA